MGIVARYTRCHYNSSVPAVPVAVFCGVLSRAVARFAAFITAGVYRISTVARAVSDRAQGAQGGAQETQKKKSPDQVRAGFCYFAFFARR
jgi:hypothetical protein